jgi:A/G-specific adenine glycosylase
MDRMSYVAKVVDEQKRRSFVRRVLSWGRSNRRDFPWRGERDPFRVLVAEVLLQRSRGTTVAGVYGELFRRWPNAAELAEADETEIAQVIRPLGLTGRARSLKQLALQVVEFGGVPRSVEAMLRLAGVGRYSASATAASAFGKEQATVDGTSARVYRRVFGVTAPRDAQVDDELWELVVEVSPKRGAIREWNWAVLDLASEICLPKIPRCLECPVLEQCAYGSSRPWTLSQGSPRITRV